MKSIKNILFVIPLVFIFGCEKDITVDLPNPEPKIVVEGYITPGANAYVFLSRSAAFFAPSDNNSLLGSAIKDAVVTIFNGISVDTLIAPDPSLGYLYISPVMTGEVGRSYFLKVETTEGEVVTSVTTIPAPVPLDSLWFQLQGESDSLGWLWATLSDPAIIENQYRWFAKRIGKDNDFITPSGSVFEDKFFDGLSFDFAYNRGEPPYSTAEEDENEEDGFYKIGDTIAVKFASITKESYKFWRAAETQVVSNGSPFGTPAPLETNIVGGIGIWEGFSFSLDTVYAQ